MNVFESTSAAGLVEIEIVLVDTTQYTMQGRALSYGQSGGAEKPVRLLSATPVDRSRGSGVVSFPRQGDKALAYDVGPFFYVIGWYSDLNSRGHSYGLEDEPARSEGDVTIKGRARNFLNMYVDGGIELWSTFWANIKMDSSINKLTAMFESMRIKLMGATIEHNVEYDRTGLGSDKTTSTVMAASEYEPTTLSDGTKDLKTPNLFLTVPTQNPKDYGYISKAVMKAGHSSDGRVLEIDTRQSSGSTPPFFNKMKDQFTQDVRGWRDNGVAWETLVESEPDGLVIKEQKGLIPEGPLSPDLYIHKVELTDGDITKTHQLAGSNVVFDKVEKANVFETSATVDEDGIHTSIVKNTANIGAEVTRSHTINPTTGDLESFTLSKGDETLLTITVNDLGAVAITASSDVTLLSTGAVDIEAQGEAGAGKTYVDSTNDDVRVGINPTDDSSAALTEGLDGIITPSTVFGRGANIWIDTFTGMPFIGSEKVMAKRDKA